MLSFALRAGGLPFSLVAFPVAGFGYLVWALLCFEIASTSLAEVENVLGVREAAWSGAQFARELGENTVLETVVASCCCEDCLVRAAWDVRVFDVSAVEFVVGYAHLD